MRGEKPCIFHELKNICDKFDMFLQTYVFEVFNDLRFIQMTLRKLGSTYLIIFLSAGTDYKIHVEVVGSRSASINKKIK